MNIYFTLLVLALFYTPLSKYIQDMYTENFMSRFPILFLADSVTAQFLSLSTEYYYRMTKLQVYIDDMTGAFNRKYFIEMLEDPKVIGNDLCITVIDVNGLKETNDTLGHTAGDELIRAVPLFAREAFGKNVIIARMGGDEFAILTYGTFDEVSEKIKAMKDHALKYKGIYVREVYLSAGIACQSEYKDLTPEGLYHTADKLMYEDKSAFYRQKGHDRRHDRRQR